MPKVTLTLEFDSEAELIGYLGQVRNGSAAPGQAETTGPETETAAKDSAESKQTDQAQDAPLTIEDVRQALAAYKDRTDMKTARDKLLSFRAERISDLKQEQYADFIAACTD